MKNPKHPGRLSDLVAENPDRKLVIDALVMLAVGPHDEQLAELQRLKNELTRRKMSDQAQEYWSDIAAKLEAIAEMSYAEMFSFCFDLLTQKTDNPGLLINAEAEKQG